MLSRRSFVQTIAAMGIVVPSFAAAAPPSARRLVVILQRGAQDNLHAVPPYGDPALAKLRPRLRIPPPGTEKGGLKLDGLFALHPELTTMRGLYAKGELAVLPSIATRYRGRSHFDAQNLLENGTNRPYGRSTGFLNHALTTTAPRKDGLVLGLNIPLMMAGSAPYLQYAPSTFKPASVDFTARVASMYQSDPVLSDAVETGILDEVGKDLDPGQLKAIAGGKDLPSAALVAGRLLAQRDGPRVAVLESNGWDTHSQLPYRGKVLFGQLNKAAASLQRGLGAAWKDTAVLTVSEFGRMARENGAAGSDHGTGGASFLFGGAVAGGRIVGDWPGLRGADLLDGRDLYPTMATEGVLKALLIQHLGIPEGHVERKVFPGSGSIRPVEGLLKA